MLFRKTIGNKRYYILHNEFSKKYCSVEEIALNHYKENGYPKGIHCEGSLITTLLFILFWDIIYDETVPGIFLNEIQFLPLDFYSSEFYERRKSAVEERLKNIECGWSNESLNTIIRENWHLHGYKKSLMGLQHFEPQTFCDIVLCIGRLHLKEIFKRMIKCFKIFSSGLPDLFLWNLENLDNSPMVLDM